MSRRCDAAKTVEHTTQKDQHLRRPLAAHAFEVGLNGHVNVGEGRALCTLCELVQRRLSGRVCLEAVGRP